MGRGELIGTMEEERRWGRATGGEVVVAAAGRVHCEGRSRRRRGGCSSRREAATREEERLPESVVVMGRNGRWIRSRSSRVGCNDGAGAHGEDDGVAAWGRERDLAKGSTRAG